MLISLHPSQTLCAILVLYGRLVQKSVLPHCFIERKHVIWLRGESPIYHRNFGAYIKLKERKRPAIIPTSKVKRH
jgi:hypothetical protein